MADFKSIIFKKTYASTEAEMPLFFTDLGLDFVVRQVSETRPEYAVKSFYYTPCQTTEEVQFRQAIFNDLYNDEFFQQLRSFSDTLKKLRLYLEQIEKKPYQYEKERLFVEAANSYCQLVRALDKNLSKATPASEGLQVFHHFLKEYLKSTAFQKFEKEGTAVLQQIAGIRYRLLIYDLEVTVLPEVKNDHFTEKVMDTFARLHPEAGKDYRKSFPSDSGGINHVENSIQEILALHFPERFQHLSLFYEAYQGFVDHTILDFNAELQFYLAYLQFIEPIQAAGLPFCFPEISSESKEIYSKQSFDIALASQIKEKTVCNDFHLTGKERIFVVTGPNQGGKTTFARSFGQLHYLGALGCPIPGSEARLYLPDRFFTHFEQQEDVQTLRGKLEDDLFRIQQILEKAGPDSLVILNEIFSSTTLEDAIWLGKRLMETLIKKDLLATCVTFMDELAAMDKTVSMMSTVAEKDTTKRTFKIIRKPADGLAYAMTIAQKYNLTYQQISKRMK